MAKLIEIGHIMTKYDKKMAKMTKLGQKWQNMTALDQDWPKMTKLAKNDHTKMAKLTKK